MNDFLSTLSEIINHFSSGDQLYQSAIPDVYCMKISQSGHQTAQHVSASLIIIVQGCVEIMLGGEIYQCGEAHYMATSFDLPVTFHNSATPENPFLFLKIVLDPLILSEVAAQLENNFPNDPQLSSRAIFTGEASLQMLEATARLGKLFQTPEDAPVLGPLAIREIYYHLLKSPNGNTLWQFVRSGSKMHKISQAIYSLKSDLSEDIDVPSLARAANMSRSAFFKHFKGATTMSPIQYQKNLRLMEARRLMIDEGQTAEGAAFKVGYKSPSQFSREYSRLFGNSPLRDAINIKKNGDSIHQF